MKFALISDIHGNLNALEQVLRDIEKEGAEKIHFLGDAIGYGCYPNECTKLVKQHCDIKIIGNHDYAGMGLETISNFNQMAQESMRWTQSTLTEKSIVMLADFEMQSTFLDYALVHASPSNPENWNYILTPEQAGPEFSQFSQSICFIGHSHIPAIFTEENDKTITMQLKEKYELLDDKRYIINVGSVGQPRDNDPRACYLLVNTDIPEIVYRRVEYNIKKTQAGMRKAKLPDFLVERLAIGR